MKILEGDKVNGLARPTPTWPKTEDRDTKLFDTGCCEAAMHPLLVLSPVLVELHRLH
jgi:hypothetical protein